MKKYNDIDIILSLTTNYSLSSEYIKMKILKTRFSNNNFIRETRKEKIKYLFKTN